MTQITQKKTRTFETKSASICVICGQVQPRFISSEFLIESSAKSFAKRFRGAGVGKDEIEIFEGVNVDQLLELEPGAAKI